MIEVKNVSVSYPGQKKLFRKAEKINVVKSVSFSIEKGTTLGLIGESGSGKTTLTNAILGLIRIDSGEISLFSEKFDSSSTEKEFKKAREKMQIVFQDPNSSFNSRFLVWEIISEPLFIRGERNQEVLMKEAEKMLTDVGLSREDAYRYIFEFSGGQKQRIAIARALITKPEFIICDEPTSALDVSIQAQICNLLKELQKKMDITYLFISHDLPLVMHMSDNIAVMKDGSIVEYGSKEEIKLNPKHEYTRELFSH